MERMKTDKEEKQSHSLIRQIRVYLRPILLTLSLRVLCVLCGFLSVFFVVLVAVMIFAVIVAMAAVAVAGGRVVDLGAVQPWVRVADLRQELCPWIGHQFGEDAVRP